MNTGELLNDIATFAGIDPNDSALKNLLMSPELAKVNVPDEFSSKLTTHFKSLMTEEAAKQSPVLKNHWTALALNGVDAELERTAKEIGLQDDDIKSIYSSEKNTGKRLSSIAKKIQELESKKTSEPDSKKNEALNNKIAELNNEVVRIKTDYEGKLKDSEKTFHSRLKDYKFNEKLQGKEYTDNIPKEVQFITAKNVIENSLSKDKLTVGFDPESGNLRLQTTDGTDYYVNNKMVNVDDYFSSKLAENKLLKVTGTAPATPATPASTIEVSGQSKLNNSKMLESLAASVKDLEGRSEYN